MLLSFRIKLLFTCTCSSAVITVRFGEPSYTFSEDGVTGRIEVIKSGVSDTSFQVRVIGGNVLWLKFST